MANQSCYYMGGRTTFTAMKPLLRRSPVRAIASSCRTCAGTARRDFSLLTLRNGQQAVLAVDTVALMDALDISSAIVAGFDWGARTANVIATLWPERCKAMVSVSGYLIGSQQAGRAPLAPKAEQQWWYQYYFATERGRAGYEANRREFAKLIWRTASPDWDFDESTFEKSALAFDNPDHVAIAIANYRWRLGVAEGEPDTSTSRSGSRKDPYHRTDHHARGRRQRGAPSGAERLRNEVLGPVRHRTIAGGVGHNLPQEAPEAFAQAVIDVDHSSS